MDFVITFLRDYGTLIQGVLGALFFVVIITICFIVFRNGPPSKEVARSVSIFRWFYLIFSVVMTVYILFRYHSVFGDIGFTIF